VTRAKLLLPLVLGGLAAAGCRSPEAARVRGGGPGADRARRDSAIEMHAGAKPYWRTPCLIRPLACEGPVPVHGDEWPPATKDRR
jgi:hypothetical protein